MDKSASQVRMEVELQRMKEERLMRMGIPPQPMFKMLKNRDPDPNGPPAVDYIYNEKKLNFFENDLDMKAKYGSPELDAAMEEIIQKRAKEMSDALASKYPMVWAGATSAALPPPSAGTPKINYDSDKEKEFTKVFSSLFGGSSNISHSLWTPDPNVKADDDDDSPLGILPSYKWVPVELPLYVGQQKASEVMELMERIHERHGDDDTGSLYKVQDALDGFVNAHDTHIRAGNDNGAYSAEFQFWLRLPSENYANLLSSWPRDHSAAGSYVTIHVTARVASLFFVGYDLDDSTDSSPLRVKLHIKCQNGHENRVEQVLSKLLLENGTFYVIGAADLNGSAVETFEISKMGFVDVLSGQEQILLN